MIKSFKTYLNWGSLFNIVYYIKSFFCKQVFRIWNSQLRKPNLKTELRIMISLTRVKSNCGIVTNFSLILRNSEFLMKIKFSSYVTREFFLYLITLKFPTYATNDLKESFESLRNVLRRQCSPFLKFRLFLIGLLI